MIANKGMDNMVENTQKGFSLLEVLISITVVSFGLVGLAKLQAELARETADVRDRMLALNLLKQKTADLKRFEALMTTSGMNAYQDITNNAGGSLSAGSYDGFSLSWCVDTDNCQGSAYDGEYYYGSANAAATTTDPGATNYPNFKKVKLNVAWTNAKGETKTLSRETIVIPKLNDDSGIVANASTSLAYSMTISADNSTVVSLPSSATDNGDGTSAVEVNGNNLTFDSTTGELTAINGIAGNYLTISGHIRLDTNPVAATENVDNITVTGTSINCIYPYTSGSGYYECYFDESFSGNIVIDGFSPDVACPSNVYNYSAVTSSIKNQDFEIRKKNCN